MVTKGDDSITISNVVRPCVQSKGDNNMQRPTSSDLVCCPTAMMVCHAQHYSTLSMLFKGNDDLQRSLSFDRVFWLREMMAYHAKVVPPCVKSQGKDGMPRLKSSDRLCFPMAIMA